MKKAGVVALVLVGMMVVSGPLWAASVRTLVPRLTVSQEYTDNADLDPSDRREEWTTVVSPGLDLSVLWKSRGLSLSYSPGFTYASEEEGDSQIRHNLSADYWDQVTQRLHLRVSETLQRTELPYTVEEPDFRRTRTEPTITEQPEGPPVEVQEPIVERSTDRTIRRNRQAYTESQTAVSAEYRFGERDRLTASYAFSLLENDDPDVEDNRRHRPSLTLTWWPWDHYGIETGVSYERGDYSGETDYTNDYQGHVRFIREFSQHLNGFVGYRHTVSDAAGVEDDYQVFEPFAGVDWQPAKDFFASLSLGYFHKKDDTGGDESGVTVSGDLGKSWRFRRGSVRLSGGTGYEQSYGGAENLGFTIYYQAMLTGSYALSRRMDSFASLSFVRNEYPDEEPSRDDNTYTATAGLHYRMLRWLYLNLTYTHRYLDSNLNENDYRENRVALSVSFVPEHGIRFK